MLGLLEDFKEFEFIVWMVFLLNNIGFLLDGILEFIVFFVIFFMVFIVFVFIFVLIFDGVLIFNFLFVWSKVFWFVLLLKFDVKDLFIGVWIIVLLVGDDIDRIFDMLEIVVCVSRGVINVYLFKVFCSCNFCWSKFVVEFICNIFIWLFIIFWLLRCILK